MAFVESSREGAVGILCLNDPARRNALSVTMREELISSIQALTTDASVRALVITGADGEFSAGGDLGAMPPESPAAAEERLGRIRLLVELVAGAAIPVVAAIEGVAAGVAAGIAASCDVVVVAEDARFLFPFARLGLVPDGGSLATVAQRVGPARARLLFLLAEPVSAGDAVAMGLADRVVGSGTALGSAVAIAAELGARAPGSVRVIKTFYADGRLNVRDALDAEATHQPARYFSAEFAEGKAAFLQRRPPEFT